MKNLLYVNDKKIRYEDWIKKIIVDNEENPNFHYIYMSLRKRDRKFIDYIMTKYKFKIKR